MNVSKEKEISSSEIEQAFEKMGYKVFKSKITHERNYIEGFSLRDEPTYWGHIKLLIASKV